MEASQLLKRMKKDTAHHEQELTVVKESGAFQVARTEAAKFASAELATVEQIASNQRSHYVRQFHEWFGSDPASDVPHPVTEHERNASLGRWGARLLMGFEVAFAAWLTATFNFAQHLWTAMAVTASLWLAASNGMARLVSMLLRRRSEVPHETRNRIHKALRVLLIVWLSAAALVLIMRTAQGKTASVLSHATTYTLAAWAIDTILLAACGICADRLFSWSGHATREYYAITRMRNRLAHLLSRCTSPTEFPSNSAASAIAVKLAVVVLGVAIGLSTTTARAQNTTKPLGEGCTFVDQTSSVDASALKSVLEQHRDVVSSVAQTEPIKSWCFVPFTGNAWTAEPVATITTEEPPPASCSGPKLGESDSLFRGAREERVRKAQEACASAKARSASKLSDDVTNAVGLVERSTPQRSRCSSVLDALDRVARTPGLTDAVIVTDGQENCGPWRSVAAPGHALRSVVVLVSSVHDTDSGVSPAALFATRKAALLRAAPWISVVTPAWGFTPDLFRSGDLSSTLSTRDSLQQSGGVR